METPERNAEYFANKMRESRLRRSTTMLPCDCGQKPFKLDCAGVPVCWRCNELEHHSAQFRSNLQALTTIRPEKKEPSYKEFAVKIKDDENSILVTAHGNYKLTLTYDIATT